MTEQQAARQILDTIQYVTLATADGDGRPWATPVWFAHDGGATFVWLSRPTTRHSRNILQRNDISLVVFDSTVAANTGVGVYAEAVAHEVGDAEIDLALAIYGRSQTDVGMSAVAREQVTGEGQFRLYAATVSHLYLLDDHDQRIPVGTPL